MMTKYFEQYLSIGEYKQHFDNADNLWFIDKLLLSRLFDSQLPLAKRESLAKRAAALFCAERHNQHLLSMLHSSDVEHRSIAAILLGFSKNNVVFPALIACLKDRSAHVRASALVALSNLRGTQLDLVIIKSITNLLEREQDNEVIKSALRSLKYFTNSGVSSLFLRFIDNADDEIKVFCLSGLFFSCTKKDLILLKEVLYNKNSLIRKKSIEVFERHGGAEHILLLKCLLRDENQQVAKAAKRAIETIKLFA